MLSLRVFIIFRARRTDLQPVFSLKVDVNSTRIGAFPVVVLSPAKTCVPTSHCSIDTSHHMISI